MALTLAGPRLWILLKAFASWIWRQQLLRRRSGQSSISRPNPDSLQIMEESHSELGAARDILKRVFNQVFVKSIRLPESRYLNTLAWRVFWVTKMQQAFDVLVSILLSLLFIGTFVAESSGSALTANIISDSVALTSSRTCSVATDMIWGVGWSRAFSYVQQCYRKQAGTGDCNYYYNQSISYTEMRIDICPFSAKVCALNEHPAYSFDSGLVDSKYLGINAQKRYLFRRRVTCAPVILDGDNIKECTVNGSKSSERPRPKNRPLPGSFDLSNVGIEFYNAIWQPYMFDPGLYKMSALPFAHVSLHY